MRTNPTYWGHAGAGILFFCGEQVLLVLRSKSVQEPGTWGVPGGSVHGEHYADSDEYATQLPISSYLKGALDEVIEELGELPSRMREKLFGYVRYEDGGFSYITFFAEITPEERENWEITLNWENDAAEWFKFDGLPEPLHFGAEYVFDHLANKAPEDLSEIDGYL